MHLHAPSVSTAVMYEVSSQKQEPKLKERIYMNFQTERK